MVKENIYRAYDTKRKIMVYDDDLWLPDTKADESNCYPVKITHFGIQYTKKLDAKNQRYLTLYETKNGRDTQYDFYDDWEAPLIAFDYPLMEFCGKVLKNNQRLFEKDIVAIYPKDTKYFGQKSLFIIEICESFFGYQFVWEHIKGSGYECPTHILEDDLSNCEIVGNAFQNPELLEMIQ